ncbi:MAG: ribonuclease HII [Aestuariivirga sp.]|uniref:ribonuclease HII n=1 Tax=Aestuariivirga sp. TaxID=2650926 RepID=UPI0025BF327B|nr:ribonuclease HII [Aestuariivirga sp.]MCA3559430.1 ribonuclease HII [Aestuariivirga sp.]
MGKTGPDFTIELAAMRKGARPVCGIDEAGRGPWAGPVVAAAVVLDPACIPAGLDDSKKLTEARRAALFAPIMASAKVGIGIAEVDRIDRDNILQATLWAMAQALGQIGGAALALIDGNRAPPLPCPVETIVAGDAKSFSIAAASIVAKVTRDRIMVGHDASWPGYGFARHKGYGTAFHRAALQRLGPSPVHRRSFAPIAALLAER